MKAPLPMRLALLPLLCLATALQADIRPETRWADPDHVLLNVTFPGNYHASWDVDRSESGDLFVRADLAVPDEKVRGDLVLIERRAVLTRGFGKYRAEAAQSLDAAALMLQLALVLLERAEPGGPDRIDKETKIDVKDELNPILLDSGNAAGGFQPPWSIYGTIAPLKDDGRAFDFNFSFTAVSEQGSQKGSMRLHGRADFAGNVFPLRGESGLGEWTLDWRDPQDPAAATAGQATTLNELRELIRASEAP